MIPSSFKIYTDIGKLEPSTRNNLDRFGFGYRRAHDPHIKTWNLLKQGPIKEVEPIQTHLDWAKVLREFKHKVKTQSNTG
jgi:hypothetical protein